MIKILDRHQRIALQLSGGKDSLACLELLRPHLDRITVYWLNTGDSFPETRAQMDVLRQTLPHFVEIKSDVQAVRHTYGLPSDLVPASATQLGRLVGDTAPLLQDRYACCFLTLMKPMHQRMLADGITLIIRGQRADDTQKAPIQSGTVDEGIEYLFPLQEWTASQVMSYLRAEGVDLPRFYEMLEEAPDCMGCSAWWEKGTAKYLRRYHHAAYQEVQDKLDAIKVAVGLHIEHFNQEVNP